MNYCVLFEEDDRHAPMRKQHRAAHIAYQTQHHRESLEAAGPLREAEGGRPAGGLWIVEAENADAVRALVEADPYWPTGLRKSVRIFEWEQVFPIRP
jgi:uncharacterized protein YciI